MVTTYVLYSHVAKPQHNWVSFVPKRLTHVAVCCMIFQGLKGFFERGKMGKKCHHHFIGPISILRQTDVRMSEKPVSVLVENHGMCVHWETTFFAEKGGSALSIEEQQYISYVPLWCCQQRLERDPSLFSYILHHGWMQCSFSANDRNLGLLWYCRHVAWISCYRV